MNAANPPPEHHPTYAAENLTRGTIVASRVHVAGTSAQRRLGLLTTESLKPGDGLWIAPCEAIHTFGMRWPIDAAFLDREYRVRKIVRRLRPWRMAVCLLGNSVIELPAGELDSTGTEMGDRLTFRPF